jgi:hypothetical protein
MEPADVLGGAAASHIPVIVDMLEGIGDHRYEFMSAEQFDVIVKEDWVEGQRIYWLEILYRGHFAASTSLKGPHDGSTGCSRCRTTRT